MQQQNFGMGCQLGSWALAAGVGLLVFILLLVIGDWGVIASIFMAGLAFVVLGAVFNWLFCRDLPAARGPGNADEGHVADTTAPAPAAPAPTAAAPVASSAVETTSPATAAPATADAKPDVRTATAKADAEAGSQVKPSAKLAGQDDLASRKGAWKYEGDGDKAAPAAAASTPDYDGDGKQEGGAEGAKPATLSAAREGGPDNLKEIKGVGPKLEKLLNSMGFYHFDQIANWTADEEAWVNANLEGFKGRVSRDNWVEQAKILASGGDTEFSKRVDKGDVY